MARSNTNVAKWGTSLAVRIPKAIADAAQLKPGDEVEVELQDRAIIIQAVAAKPTLQQLIDGITPENCHPATDWGAGRRQGSMVSHNWTPDRGDLVWLTFDPQAGREQAGRRPALVLSPGAYNGKTGLSLMCPITSQQKGYPFEVPLPADLPVHGFVLADHLKSVDWKQREAAFIGRVRADVLAAVLNRIGPLLGL